MIIRVLWVLALCAATVWSEKKPVTLEVAAAYRGNEGVTPVWSPDGQRFAFVETRRVRVYQCATGESKTVASLEDLQMKATKVEEGAFGWKNRRVEESRPQWTPDGAWLLISAGGDLFLVASDGSATKQLTSTPVTEDDPRLSPDGKTIGMRIGSDLYSMGIERTPARRLTFDGSATIWNGKLDWVYPEELSISRAWWWSPDSSEIAYLQFDVSKETIHPHVDPGPIQAVYEPQRYPKAGTANASLKLGVLSARGGKTRWMNIGPTEDALVSRVAWMPNGKELAVQKLNRLQNHLELLAFSTATGKARLLLEERDAAWVNQHDMMQFFADGRFLWGSERTGHLHLYLYGKDGARPLTSGEWDVVLLERVDEKQGVVYFTSTKDGVLDRQLYRVSVSGGTIERVTKEAGTHKVSIAPGGSWWLDHWSSTTASQRQVLRDASGAIKSVVREARKEPEEYDLQPVENLTFRGKDGTLFYGQLIKPAGFSATRQYPAVVMVYGGPHSQTVRNMWGGPNWDQALAARGYVVWRMDNRGMNYRGHAFESVIHRNLGRQELADQLEGVDYLKKLGFVDFKRIGIYGWSYGGYMTLYSLFHSPKTFAAGIAGAPVTDWRHYDTIYTERYMGLPSKNEEGYKASSPVHAASNLEAKLLLVHNFQDDNVLFQNTQQMMEALQKAGKRFETMFYPLKSHGVTGPLRLHMLREMTDFFDRNLRAN